MAYMIHLEKEAFKFSGTHFTIFSPETAERLHGHNYYVKLSLEVTEIDPRLGMAVDFNLVKPEVKAVCHQLDEYVLIPAKSPYVKITPDGSQVNVQFKDKLYSFPVTDVKILPLVNITSEELANYIGHELQRRLAGSIKFTCLTITVEESRGQGASLTIRT